MLDTLTPPSVVALRKGGPDAKPLLRGVAHRVAALASPAAALLLVARAHSARAMLAAALYGFALVALFAVSGLYHLKVWSPSSRVWLARLDHANIFLFIAGTGVPIHLLGVGGALGLGIVVAIAAGALLGVAQTLFWPRAPRTLHVALYVLVASPGFIGFGELHARMGNGPIVLQAVGGVLYVLGAMAYERRRPDPFPAVFGYHEVFHALVIAATGFFYGAVYQCVSLG